MNYNFETSLPVGLIMSMYDFNIPVESQSLNQDSSRSKSFAITDQISTEKNDEAHEHIWLNGELSWRL